MDRLRLNGELVDALASACHHGQEDLRNVPDLVVQVITERAWADRIVPQTGERSGFSSFIEFVTAAPLDGLGMDLESIEKLCVDNPTARSKLDKLKQQPVGTNQHSEGVDIINTLRRPDGTSTEAALRRLRKDRPDLHERVLAGELSPHRAAVTAGFRSRRFSVPGDPQGAARTLRRHMSPEDIGELVIALQAEDHEDEP